MKQIPLLRAATCVGQHFITDAATKERATTIDAGEEIRVERVTDNEHDAFAVAVVCPALGVRLGWIQATMSPIVFLLLEHTANLKGTVVGRGKNGNFTFNLWLETEE